MDQLEARLAGGPAAQQADDELQAAVGSVAALWGRDELQVSQQLACSGVGDRGGGDAAARRGQVDAGKRLHDAGEFLAGGILLSLANVSSTLKGMDMTVSCDLERFEDREAAAAQLKQLRLQPLPCMQSCCKTPKNATGLPCRHSSSSPAWACASLCCL